MCIRVSPSRVRASVDWSAKRSCPQTLASDLSGFKCVFTSDTYSHPPNMLNNTCCSLSMGLGYRLLGSRTPDKALDATTRQVLLDVAQVLDDFNNGVIGSGVCGGG